MKRSQISAVLKLLFLAVAFLIILPGCGEKKKARIKSRVIEAVDFNQVEVADNFWSKRIEINRTITIPAIFGKCQETGRIDNFAIAGGLKKGEYKGVYPFDDTDVYKAIEAASYSLAVYPDAAMERYIDGLIGIIAAAQEKDGYLCTARTAKATSVKWPLGQRWGSEAQNSHELYNMGHLYEAAVAHYYATGKRNLLDIALKNADLLCNTFGPGKIQTPPGHQEIEIGLVKLYRATGQEKFWRLAKFFLDIRGPGGEEYKQTHKKVIDQNEVVGHAVRATYMYSAMADIVALTGDEDYLNALNKLWDNLVSKKIYITGGVGANPSNEGFGPNFDLPNMSAYCETCASIGNIFFNQRMFLLNGDAEYIDVLERTLYNSLLSGVSLDGRLFFYPNPLASRGQHTRSDWFVCACCPPNIARLIASMPGFIYAHKDSNIYINLFVAGRTKIKIGDNIIEVSQQTNYPWDGAVKVIIEPQRSEEFNVLLRIPGWAQNKPLPGDLYHYIDSADQQLSLKLNGSPISYKTDKGYACVKRLWEKGDIIELNMPMSVRRIAANRQVAEDSGKVVLQRGPIVYCVEWPDVEKGNVFNLLLPDDEKLEAEYREDLLGGVNVIKGKVLGFPLKDRQKKDFTAIPYYAWANRGPGEMAVWLAADTSAVEPLGSPAIAQKSTIAASQKGVGIEAVNDGRTPTSSFDTSIPVFSFFPQKGTTEWIEYDFPQVYEPSIVEVYWLTDSDNAVPESWKIQYKEADQWKDVWTTGVYGVEKDKFNRVIFETVRTKAIRLEIKMQKDSAAGIFEWQVK
jgi:DUF1680 family protein